MATAAPPLGAATDDKQWFAFSGEDVASDLGVDQARACPPPRWAARTEQYGPNKFAEAKAEPRWRAFVRQYHDAMQVVLLVVGIGSIWPLHQYGTGIVVLLLTVFNAVLGLQPGGQGGRGGRGAPEDDVHQGAGAARRRARRAARRSSSSPATSSRSRRATSSRPTGACSRRPRSRSPSRR